MSASSRAAFDLQEAEEVVEALQWYEGRNITLMESKGKTNEHSDINNRGKWFGQVNQLAAHESSGNAVDSVNREAPPF